MTDNITLNGAEVRLRRIEMGLSQARLAFKISQLRGEVLDPSAISYWENEARMPHPDNLTWLAQALGCKVRKIIKKKEVGNE